MSTSGFNMLEGPENNVHSLLLSEDNPMAPAPEENWRSCFPEIIGRSQPMLTVLETVSKIARSDSAVLVFGESGTGKELIASAIHRLSPRSDKRFIAVNCSAIPENLLESTLFGHKRGAFTDAKTDHKGLFETCSGGTLFLDEIGDMPQSLQAKLLRVLQDKQFTPLGGTQMQYADVRIITATNIDLEKALRAGTFRLDLYYRLNVLPIYLPPLRERRDDIPALLDHFLENANRVHRPNKPCFLARETVEHLVRYSWPGNVRQLQNLVQRLVVMCDGGAICPEHVPEEIFAYHEEGKATFTHTGQLPRSSLLQGASKTSQGPFARPGAQASKPLCDSAVRFPAEFGKLPSGDLPAEGIDMPTFIENLENGFIMQALQRTNFNKNQAARLLGLNRTTLVERIKKRKLAPLNMPSSEL